MRLIRPTQEIVNTYNSFWTPNPITTELALFDDDLKIDVNKYIKQFNSFEALDKEIHNKDEIEEFFKAINDSYHTRVLGGVSQIVKELASIGINNKTELSAQVKKGLITLPKFVEICKKATGNYTYSFATKVFSFIDHKYPIVDSYVVTVLDAYEYKGKISKSKWGNYSKYVENYKAFKEHFGLNGSCKEIDKFLWTYGKILDDYWTDMGVLRFESVSFEAKSIEIK